MVAYLPLRFLRITYLLSYLLIFDLRLSVLHFSSLRPFPYTAPSDEIPELVETQKRPRTAALQKFTHELC